MRTLLLTLFCGAVLAGQAQELPMTFSAFTSEVYAPLQNPISVNNGEIWDDPEYIVPIGFPFTMFGTTATDLNFFGTGAVVGIISPELDLQLMVPAFSDLIDMGYLNLEVSMSPITYEVTGTAPNRIFKLDWSNCGFYYEIVDNGTANNVFNLQLWLYETTNVIEYRFGPRSIPNPELAHDFGYPASGIIKGVNILAQTVQGSWLLGGPANNPVPAFLDLVNGQPGPEHLLFTDPIEGQVYRFAPIIIPGVKENDPVAAFSLYPTEVNDQFFVRLEEGSNANFTVRNLLGAEVMTGRLNRGLNTLETSALQSGLYLFTSAGTTVRFVKK